MSEYKPEEAAQMHGWLAPELRTRDQQETAEMIVGEMPEFEISGAFSSKERAPLWQAFGKIGVDEIPYIWQSTGSCVGAGGCNMLMTLMAVEISAGEMEEFIHPWWPFTYGKSREIAGMRRPGDGSYGAAWARAIRDYGIFRADIDGLPDFSVRSGWLSLPSSTEYKWSDGDDIPQKWVDKGREHLVKTASEIRNAEQAAAALENGYPITIASMFGTRTIRTKGTPAVNIAEYDASWAHQMFIDESWRHPTEGLLIRIGNNWGPDAHKRPSSGEPRGGFYITAKTFDRIARSSGSEIYAFSSFDGFPARQLDWDVITF